MASPRVIENNDTFNDYEVRADGEDEQEDDINEKIHLAEEVIFFLSNMYLNLVDHFFMIQWLTSEFMYHSDL